MKNKSVLVVFHSRTGNNRSLSEAIKQELNADVMELDDNGQPKSNKIKLSDYSRLIFCFPIWAFRPATPIRKFLDQHDLGGKKVGAITICGGHPWRSEKSFKKSVEKSGGSFAGFFSIKDSKDREADNKIALEKARQILD